MFRALSGSLCFALALSSLGVHGALRLEFGTPDRGVSLGLECTVDAPDEGARIAGELSEDGRVVVHLGNHPASMAARRATASRCTHSLPAALADAFASAKAAAWARQSTIFTQFLPREEKSRDT